MRPIIFGLGYSCQKVSSTRNLQEKKRKGLTNLVYEILHKIMEGIVVGLAQISFCQHLSGIARENSVPNFFNKSSPTMSDSESLIPTSEETNISDQEVNRSSPDVSAEETNNDSAWEEIGDDLGNKRQNKIGYTLSERRQMPNRASKDASLLGIKRRTIMKPVKRLKSHEDFKSLKTSDIKKIYLNKKLTNFRPSSLETIFEEAPAAQSNENGINRLMGGRKIRRSLCLSDGFRYSKTLVSRRRAKIKKNFGKKFALKKISLEEFIIKLNSSIEKNEDQPVDCCMDDHRSVVLQEQLKTYPSNTTEDLDGILNLYSSCSNAINTMSPSSTY